MLQLILALLGVAGLLTGAVYFVHRTLSNQVSLDETSAALKDEAQRVSQMESAAEEARKQRAQEFDARASSVRSPDDAAALLRSATDGNVETH